jgi:hypothetical protein
MAFQPFHIFSKELLQAFIARDQRFFVRQSYQGGLPVMEPEVKGSFIISHYDTLTTALDHYGAISHDASRFLYHWDNPDHRDRLQKAAVGLKEYRIYSTVFRTDWEKGITDAYREKLRQYVQSLGWNIPRDEGLNTNYELQFGELYVRLKAGKREVKVKVM